MFCADVFFLQALYTRCKVCPWEDRCRFRVFSSTLTLAHINCNQTPINHSVILIILHGCSVEGKHDKNEGQGGGGMEVSRLSVLS